MRSKINQYLKQHKEKLIFFIRHSLMVFEIPNTADKLSITGNQTFSYDANIGNGTNLLWYWEHPETVQAISIQKIASGIYFLKIENEVFKFIKH